MLKGSLFFLSVGCVAVLAGCSGNGSTAPRPHVVQAAPQYLYVANSNSPGSISAFPLTSNGNVAPTLTIAGSNTPFGAAFPYSLALNAAGELYTAYNSGSFNGGVAEFAPGAAGNVAASGAITPANGIATGVAVDTTGRVYLADDFSNDVEVFPANAMSTTAPTQTISGSATMLASPQAICVDASGNIYVANGNPQNLSVYAFGANGNASPIRTLNVVTEAMTVDSVGRLYAAMADSLVVFAAGASGAATPIQTISGSATGLGFVTGVAVDTSDRIYVSIAAANAIEIFAPGATGNVPPIAIISGANTLLNGPRGLTIH